LRFDNGPEILSKKLVEWSEKNNVINYIEPGKPAKNRYIERFNRAYREDVTNQYRFKDLEQVSRITDDWMVMYNGDKPHSPFNHKIPWECLPGKSVYFYLVL